MSAVFPVTNARAPFSPLASLPPTPRPGEDFLFSHPSNHLNLPGANPPLSPPLLHSAGGGRLHRNVQAPAPRPGTRARPLRPGGGLVPPRCPALAPLAASRAVWGAWPGAPPLPSPASEAASRQVRALAQARGSAPGLSRATPTPASHTGFILPPPERSWQRRRGPARSCRSPRAEQCAL